MNKAKMLGETFQLRMDLLDFETRLRSNVTPDLHVAELREELQGFADHVKEIMDILEPPQHEHVKSHE